MSLRPCHHQAAVEDEDQERAEAFRRFSASSYAGRALGSSNAGAMRIGFEEGWDAALERRWRA